MATTPGGDQALLDRLKAGEAEAYAELVGANTGAMLAACRRILRDEEDARDAIQDAFLQAFQHLSDFRGGARLSTWLYRIAVNAALMKLRSRQRKREDPIEPLLPSFLPDGHRADPGPAWTPDPADEIDRLRRLRVVRERIDELPESYRTVLLLRDVEGYTTEEAAAALGLKTDALKMRLHRARQALRTLLDPELRSRAA